MTWGNRIEGFRQYVLWECKDIPPDIIMAIIRHESGGIPGRVGAVGTKCGDLPSMHGGTVRVCNALGLMQLHPLTAKGWNDLGRETVYVEDLKGADERSIRLQIRLGCWYYAACVARLHKWDATTFPSLSAATADPNHLQLALVGYAIGAGGLIKKLKQLQEAGKPLTIESLKSNFPNWGRSKKTGKWLNRPLHYASTVWSKYVENQTGGGGDPSTPPPLKAITAGVDGSGILILAALGAAAYWFLKKELVR